MQYPIKEGRKSVFLGRRGDSVAVEELVLQVCYLRMMIDTYRVYL